MEATRYESLIGRVTARIYELEPSLMDKYGQRGKEKCREDNGHHLRYLETAYKLDDSRIFNDYAIWLSGILSRHGMETRHLADNFRLIAEEAIAEEGLEISKREAFRRYLQEAIDVLEQTED